MPITAVPAERSVPLEKTAKTRAVRNVRRASTSESDADLAARFAREAEPLFDVLSRGARRLTRSDADAEDLLQDTLLHAYAGFRSFREGSNLKAWLFRILYNRWVSAYRGKQARPAEVSVDAITERDLACSASRLPVGPRSAEAEVLDALPDSEIKAALATLPEGFRTVVYYADVQGYTYAETAAILDIPMGTVMSRVSRGRQRLRIALAHLAPNRGDFATAQPLVA
jgi:RNA polymerase sigma-70 factor (TIGR02947 family)